MFPSLQGRIPQPDAVLGPPAGSAPGTEPAQLRPALPAERGGVGAADQVGGGGGGGGGGGAETQPDNNHHNLHQQNNHFNGGDQRCAGQ